MSIVKKGIYGLTILLVLLLTGFSVSGQTDTLTVLDEEIKIGWFGKKEYRFTFEKKDVILFSFSEEGKLPMRYVEVKDETRNKVVGQFTRPEDIIEKPFLVPADGDFSFIFKNYGLRKRKGQVNIKRVPKDPIIIYKDSIVVDTFVTTKTVTTIVLDTLPEDILETWVQVASTLNIDTLPRECIEIPAPPLDKYYFAYWTGQGGDTKSEFDALAAKPKIQWLREEVSEPLMAYGKNLTDALPKWKGPETVKFFLSSQGNSERFLGNKSFSARNTINESGYINSFGKVNMLYFMEVSPIMLCFDNQNSVTPVDFYIKVLGFRVQPRTVESEIEKIEITERVIKVEVKKIKG